MFDQSGSISQTDSTNMDVDLLSLYPLSQKKTFGPITDFNSGWIRSYLSVK